MNFITAKVIADSVNSQGNRLTTIECEYPRFIHCFDETTEVLSQIAEEQPRFRTFKEVSTLGIKVGQIDKGIIDFVYPSDYTEKTGEFEMVSTLKQTFPLFCTDGHRVYAEKRTTNNKFLPTVLEAKDLVQPYGCLRIPQSGVFKSNQIFSNEELALIVWFVADGHLPKTGKQCQFHFKKERKILSVITLLSQLGIPFTKSVYNENTVIRFETPAWASLCYDSKGKKRFPDSSMQMSMEGYAVFKQALLESDGSVRNQDYNTTVREVAEQIQMAAILHNDSINLQETSYARGMYKITFKDTNYISLRQDKDVFTKSPFIGTVYCVTVPSSFIVVRRKGVVFVTGNCEVMTHRMFSRNAQSSRAVPVSSTINANKVFVKPYVWGKNQAGMSSKEVLTGFKKNLASLVWNTTARMCFTSSLLLSKIGLHKQWSNRMTEWCSTIKVVVTATEWDNFFWLRLDEGAAQPEIVELARTILGAMDDSFPELLEVGQWHLPYINVTRYKGEDLYYDSNANLLTLDEAKQISASCCAQISYRKLNDSKEKAIAIYGRLFSGEKPHESPVEHQGTPLETLQFTKQVMGVEGLKGATHIDIEGKQWSANFKGWAQLRQIMYQDK